MGEIEGTSVALAFEANMCTLRRCPIPVVRLPSISRAPQQLLMFRFFSSLYFYPHQEKYYELHMILNYKIYYSITKNVYCLRASCFITFSAFCTFWINEEDEFSKWEFWTQEMNMISVSASQMILDSDWLLGMKNESPGTQY